MFQISAMTFLGGAFDYDRFMGRYSVLLAPFLADFSGIESGQTVLDVGCGPGALTGELVRRLGSASVSAVDPSESFVAAARERHPGVTVQLAAAEELPYRNGTFDGALAQLVVHFMTDPVAGLGEMARVTRPGGVVAACVWDHAGGHGPLGPFWEAARELDPTVEDQSQVAGAREGHLAELFVAAGLTEVAVSVLSFSVTHPSFDDWWEPFALGVGPAGCYAAGLGTVAQIKLRELCRQNLPQAPFVLKLRAWAARGVVSPKPPRTGGNAPWY